MSHFAELVESAKASGSIKIAVAAANDFYVLESLLQATQEGLAEAILVGRRHEIETALKEAGISSGLFEIVHVDGDLFAQSKRAVELIMEGRAQVLMKGKVDTSTLLRAVLAEKRLRTAQGMSVVGVLEVPVYPKLILATDIGMNIEPDLERKVQIVNNAVQVAEAIGVEQPKVAMICAKEKLDFKMQATLDARLLVDMNRQGMISGCQIGGPFALDNAISSEAAMHKAIDDPVAGDADVLIFPDLVSGNVFYKSLVFLAQGKSAATVVGAGIPIVVTSRSDSKESKFYSIAVAVLLSHGKRNR